MLYAWEDERTGCDAWHYNSNKKLMAMIVARVNSSWALPVIAAQSKSPALA